MASLSVLIPVYNCNAYRLVTDLLAQKGWAMWERWEIIVADDASTDGACREANQKIAALPHCRYLLLERNKGRAAIRNYLVSVATTDYVLLIDGDMTLVSADFIQNYARHSAQVVYGGYCAIAPSKNNLRYRCEVAALARQGVSQRRKHPYWHFHTCNYFIQRALALQIPLEESYTGYGYEDVAYGKALQQAGIPVAHIDNPVGFCLFEDNATFLDKTDAALHTLCQHYEELTDYVALIGMHRKLRGLHVDTLAALGYRCFGKRLRARLCCHAPLLLFQAYKLMYFSYLYSTKVWRDPIS